MTRVLVIYYSRYGHIRQLAQAQAEGARVVPGTQVDVRRVPDIVDLEKRRRAGFLMDETPEVQAETLADYDALIFGSPTCFGNVAAEMKFFIDRCSFLWSRHALVGKVAGAFTSTGSQHGGHEQTLLALHTSFLHFGMVIAGLPYTFEGQSKMDEIVGGAPYGAGTITSADGSRQPGESELDGARYQGQYIATLASKLAATEPMLTELVS